jgi:hypothetical protein
VSAQCLDVVCTRVCARHRRLAYILDFQSLYTHSGTYPFLGLIDNDQQQRFESLLSTGRSGSGPGRRDSPACLIHADLHVSLVKVAILILVVPVLVEHEQCWLSTSSASSRAYCLSYSVSDSSSGSASPRPARSSIAARLAWVASSKHGYSVMVNPPAWSSSSSTPSRSVCTVPRHQSFVIHLCSGLTEP